MGVKGAAYATIISQFILCIWVFRHFISSRAVVRLKIKHMRLEPIIISRILSIGMAPFAMQTAASLVQVIFNTQLIKYGSDIAVGAMGIINSVAILIVMTIISVNMASQPIIGYNYGACKYGRVRKTLNIGIKAATWISVIAFVLVELFPGSIIQLFNNDNSELFQTGVHGIRIYIAMLPLVGWQIITSNYFQSIGKAKISLLLTLMRQVIVLMPLLFILPGIFGLDGIWIAGPVSDFVSSCVVFVFFRIERKKLRLLEKKER
jgi:Na+-driven multidrug efflux pump